jgi:PqqD family protein of HPr-rel-A system
VETVSETEIDGEMVLLDTSSGALHVLNPTAAAVWAELDGERGVDRIVADLSAVADADSDRVREDVIRFLGELERAGLVARAAPSESADRSPTPD